MYYKIFYLFIGPHLHHHSQPHHHHSSGSHRVHHHHQAVYMPGGHVDVQYLQNNQIVQQKPPSSRGSHSSDTSSAYSGSDTMQVSV